MGSGVDKPPSASEPIAGARDCYPRLTSARHGRPGDRLCSRVRSCPTERDRPAGAGRTTADEHRYRLDPRRCRRRLKPDRATQGEDNHPRSSARTQGGRAVLSSWLDSDESVVWAESRPIGVAQGTAGIGRRPAFGVTRYRLISAHRRRSSPARRSAAIDGKQKLA
jgi:hypothetical protein